MYHIDSDNPASPDDALTSGKLAKLPAPLALPDQTAQKPQRLELVPPLLPPAIDEQAELKAQAQDLLHQADSYLMEDEVEVAIAHYRRALQLAPHLVDAHHGLAEALSRQGRLEEAAIYYQKALDLLPLPDATVTEVSPAAADAAAPAEPVAIDRLPWYEQAAFYLQQGKALSDRQQWKETIVACEQAAKLLTPPTALTFRLLGRALQAEKQLDAAEASFRKSLALEPELAENQARLGSVCAEQQRLTEAVQFLEQAIALDPKFAGAYLKLAEVWQQIGDAAQAANCFYQAYQLEPSWATAKDHLQLGNLLMSQGKLEQANECYRQVMASAPNSPDGYYNLAIALGKQHHWSEAVAYHQQAVDRQPQTPRLHAALGRALTMLGRWQEAIDCYQRITTLKPDYPQLQAALVQLERCQRALVAESYGKMGDTWAAQQQWQEAIDCYRQAVDRNPQNVKFQVGLAQAHVALAQWEAALDCYQVAIDLQPNQPQHRIALAEVFVKLKRFEEAAQCYRQVVDPTEASAPAAATEAALAPIDSSYTVL